MHQAIAVDVPRLWERFGRVVLVAMVALTIAVGSIGFSGGQAEAARGAQVDQALCDDLAAGVWDWLAEGQDAAKRGEYYAEVVANTFAQWYFNAWGYYGCAG